MRKILSLIIALALAFCAGFYVAGQVSGDGTTVFERITGITLPRITQSEEVTAEIVKAKLSERAELTTYSAEYTVTLGKNETKSIFKDVELGITRNSILITAGGIVKVGYDIADINVEVDGNKIYVNLPDQAKLNDNYVIWDTVECDEHNNIFNMIEFEQYYDMIDEIESMGLKKAEAAGIYNAAEEHMKSIVELILAEFSGYEVEFV